jgi:hypothetical protein
MILAGHRPLGCHGIPLAALALAATLVAPAGVGVAIGESRTSRISVVFVDPERFTDVRDGAQASPRGQAALLDELARFARETGERLVPADLSLELRVTDVDLAGEFEPWRGPQFERTRFMREIYMPRIDLEFRLADVQGRVVGEGRRSLRDANYLARSIRLTDERLRYEKDLLREWFRREFAR